MSNHYDDNFFLQIKSGDQRAFKQLFDQNFLIICRYLYRIVPDNQLAEDVAQEVFIEFWKKREDIQIHTSLTAFLKVSGRNRLLNHLRKKNLKWDDLDHVSDIPAQELSGQRHMEHVEFKSMVHKAIDQLPPKCRTVFALSRFEEMSYKQIAEHLDISIKTVENQMSKALKFLRQQINISNNKKV